MFLRPRADANTLMAAVTSYYRSSWMDDGLQLRFRARGESEV